MTIYSTRYQAQKNKRGDEKVVKVCGGYAVITQEEYHIWKNQK